MACFFCFVFVHLAHALRRAVVGTHLSCFMFCFRKMWTGLSTPILAHQKSAITTRSKTAREAVGPPEVWKVKLLTWALMLAPPLPWTLGWIRVTPHWHRAVAVASTYALPWAAHCCFTSSHVWPAGRVGVGSAVVVGVELSVVDVGNVADVVVLPIHCEKTM